MNSDELKREIRRLAEANDPQLLEQTVRLLHQTCRGWNWVGIYLLIGNELFLGPYIGKPTDHARIPVGTGVCGTAVKEDRNLIVDDVSKVENYLACTLETRSELVVLIRHEGRVVGQFDIDSDQIAAFSLEDEDLLTDLSVLVGSACADICNRYLEQTRG